MFILLKECSVKFFFVLQNAFSNVNNGMLESRINGLNFIIKKPNVLGAQLPRVITILPWAWFVCIEVSLDKVLSKTRS